MNLIKDSRALVTVRTINKILPIPGADFIMEAHIDGWSCVVKKDEFKEGDYCLYFEIDSFLPANDPNFLFLRKNGVKTDDTGAERIRLRSIKLKGIISQGLALPLSVLDDKTVQELLMVVDYNLYDSIDKHSIDAMYEALETERYGIEEFLNVTKYERPDEKNGGAGNAKTAGTFPLSIPKTDEDRLQNVYGTLSTHFKDVYFRPSLKLDGSSITIGYFSDPSYFLTKLDDEIITYNEEKQELESTPIPYPHNYGTSQVIVCSRNLALKYTPESRFWQGVNNNDLATRLKEYCEEYDVQLAVQGELMGPGIQGNREKLEQYDIYAFRIWDITNKCFLDDSEFMETCTKLGIKTVPQYNVIQPFIEYSSLKEFLNASDIKSITHPIAEGLVYKSVNKVLYKGAMQTLHFKVINNKFLLKCED